MEQIIFYIIAVIMIVFAVMSVTTKNIMRAIIYLLTVMIAIAGVYFLIEFQFLAAVQMTVYAGGIIILYITSIMLVERINEPLDSPNKIHQAVAGIVTTLAAFMSIFAINTYQFNEAGIEAHTTVEQVGKALLNYGDYGYILPFEVISILLLAVMVGAIVIAKTYNKKVSTSKTETL